MNDTPQHIKELQLKIWLSKSPVIGDKFITDNKFCVLQIPSVVTRGDYNLLINPNHPDFIKIKIITTEKFPFDRRIFKLKRE